MLYEEITRQVMTDLENKKWENVEKKLTDDFTFTGGAPKPISKKDWLQVHKALATGMPDLKMNLSNPVLKDGTQVEAHVKLSGTNTADLPPVLPGTASLPKTGKKVQLPEETVRFTFKGDKISNLHVTPVAHGGVQGVLEQLNVKQPEKTVS
jgi:hypothetical protein